MVALRRSDLSQLSKARPSGSSSRRTCAEVEIGKKHTISQVGQKLRFDPLPATSGLPPINGHRQIGPAGRFRAKSERGTCSGKTNSLDPGLSICLTIAET